MDPSMSHRSIPGRRFGVVAAAATVFDVGRRRSKRRVSRQERQRAAVAAGRDGDAAVARRLGMHPATVARWRGRFGVPAAGAVPAEQLGATLRAARAAGPRRPSETASMDEQHAKGALREAGSYDYDRRRVVASDPNAGPEALTSVALGSGWDGPRKVHRRKQALVPEAPGAGYRIVETVEDLRIAVAHNPSAGDVLLRQLADADESDVVAAVASGPYTSPSLLRRLSAYPSVRVRAEAAANRRTPPAMLDRLVHDRAPWVRRAVLSHPDCPTRHVQRLAADSDTGVGNAALRADNCPPTALTAAVADANWERQTIICEHANTSADALRILAVEAGWINRQRARRRLRRGVHT